MFPLSVVVLGLLGAAAGLTFWSEDFRIEQRPIKNSALSTPAPVVEHVTESVKQNPTDEAYPQYRPKTVYIRPKQQRNKVPYEVNALVPDRYTQEKLRQYQRPYFLYKNELCEEKVNIANVTPKPMSYNEGDQYKSQKEKPFPLSVPSVTEAPRTFSRKPYMVQVPVSNSFMRGKESHYRKKEQALPPPPKQETVPHSVTTPVPYIFGQKLSALSNPMRPTVNPLFYTDEDQDLYGMNQPQYYQTEKPRYFKYPVAITPVPHLLTRAPSYKSGPSRNLKYSKKQMNTLQEDQMSHYQPRQYYPILYPFVTPVPYLMDQVSAFGGKQYLPIIQTQHEGVNFQYQYEGNNHLQNHHYYEDPQPYQTAKLTSQWNQFLSQKPASHQPERNNAQYHTEKTLLNQSTDKPPVNNEAQAPDEGSKRTIYPMIRDYPQMLPYNFVQYSPQRPQTPDTRTHPAQTSGPSSYQSVARFYHGQHSRYRNNQRHPYLLGETSSELLTNNLEEGDPPSTSGAKDSYDSAQESGLTNGQEQR